MNEILSRELFGPVADQLGWTVLHSIWQGAAVAALVALFLRILRLRSAAARHLVCLLGMAAILATSVGTAIHLRPQRADMNHRQPADTLAAQTTSGAVQMAPTRVTSVNPNDPLDAAALTKEDSNAGAIQRSIPFKKRLEPLLPWISGLWLTGVLLLSLRHLGGWLRIRQWRRAALPAIPSFLRHAGETMAAKLRLGRSAAILASDCICTPLLAGFIKPVVLIPTGLITGLSPRELEAILAHELAHLARHDVWANLFQIVCETVLFFHPAVWWLGHRARCEREEAADDLAITVLQEDRITYAKALVRIAEVEVTAGHLALAMTDGSLRERVRHILRVAPSPEPAGGGWILPLIGCIALLALIPLRAQEAPPVIELSAGQSIQAALDAAAPGAVIRLSEGEWKERIVIAKPVTLQGAGWQKSILKPNTAPAGITPEAKAEFRKQYVRGLPSEKIAAREREWLEKYEPPTILIRNTEKVVLRGLHVSGIETPKLNEAGAETRVVVQSAKAEISECAVVGPAANGVRLTDGSELEMSKSLVAALWSEGIIVQGTGNGSETKASRLHLKESDIRNIYHYGIAIGSGCDSTVIERCRISGTAWHGIRYDDASPTITGNAIYQHARFGIYASGKTSAKVIGNLLWNNEMEGISCWEQNTDVIEGNTFVGNVRGSLTVLGGSKPQVTRNIFANSPVGVAAGAIANRNGTTPEVGDPILKENLFWRTTSELSVKGETKPAPEGSMKVDPKFIGAAAFNFGLAADSPARAARIGAETALNRFEDPWPLLVQERAMVPAGDTREFRYWARDGSKPPVPTRAEAEKPTKNGPVDAGATPNAAGSSPQEIAALREKVAALEKKVTQLEASGSGERTLEKLRAENQQNARKRAVLDRERYPAEQLAEIESLYQVANKNWRSDEARTSLKQLLEKYDNANRTGCATLYMGQMSEGQERLDYLTRAVEKFSDCYYFNGCQVGGFGRYVLALTLWEKGEKDRARKLVEEMTTTYKDAIDHKGRPIPELAKELEEQFSKAPQ